MKIILLFITLLLFLHRILTTPYNISKKLHKQHVEKNIQSMKNNLNNYYLDEINRIQIISLMFGGLLYGWVLCYYTYISFIFPNTLIIILTILQIGVTVFYILKTIMSNPFSLEIKDYPFHRWFFLFNIILDYVYYILILYMLLK
jgi:hypothetical protein